LAWSSDGDDDETVAFDGQSWRATWGRVAIIAACAAAVIAIIVLVSIDGRRHRGGGDALGSPLPETTAMGDGSTPTETVEAAPPPQWTAITPPPSAAAPAPASPVPSPPTAAA
jgi:hypothetical protein